MVYIVVFSFILAFFTDLESTVSFIVGGITSIVAGWIGMQIAVYTNVRTAHQCWRDMGRGFDVAINGGSVMGLSLVSLGVLVLWCLIMGMQKYSDLIDDKLYDAIAGYGLGGSSIALFGRVGGGIYTKAADVGADLSGKNDYGMEEDDPRNPACIADNVGDNVGDIAGMGADLFGSFAEATVAALVIASGSINACADGAQPIAHNFSALFFPLLVSSSGILVGIATMVIVMAMLDSLTEELEGIEKSLKLCLIISTILQTPVIFGLAKICLPATFCLAGNSVT